MKHLLHSHHPFRIFWFSVLLTTALGGLIFAQMGLNGLWLFAILVIVELFSVGFGISQRLSASIIAGFSLWARLLGDSVFGGSV